jgi:hypothetical protein
MNTSPGVEGLPEGDAIAKLHFRLHGIATRFTDWFDSIKDRVETMLSEWRGPDPDAVVEIPSGITIDRDTLRDLIRGQYHRPGHGGISGPSKVVTVLVALNTALLVGVGGWVLATVVRHDKQLAVVQCQLDPACARAVLRGNP